MTAAKNQRINVKIDDQDKAMLEDLVENNEIIENASQLIRGWIRQANKELEKAKIQEREQQAPLPLDEEIKKYG